MCALLSTAKNSLSGIALIAEEMKKSLGEKNWNALTTMNPSVLKERLEGSPLTKAAVINHFVMDMRKHLPLDKQEKTKKFFLNWLDKIEDDDKLRRLVRAISSNNTLGKDKLNIAFTNDPAIGSPNSIPVSLGLIYQSITRIRPLLMKKWIQL